MLTKQDQARAAALNTSALVTILGSLKSPETEQRSPEHPLGGLVHVSGIGQISVAALRAELERRTSASEAAR